MLTDALSCIPTFTFQATWPHCEPLETMAPKQGNSVAMKKAPVKAPKGKSAAVKKAMKAMKTTKKVCTNTKESKKATKKKNEEDDYSWNCIWF